jgi:methylthioribose-1-phosphate isomerase
MKIKQKQIVRAVDWIDGQTPEGYGRVRILDQTKLPERVCFIETNNIREIWLAIKRLQVRGAPAIGVTAAMGLAVHIQRVPAKTSKLLLKEIEKSCRYLATARPTAVNLFWALERMKEVAQANISLSVTELKKVLIKEAIAIRDEDIAMCKAIGEYGLSLLKDCKAILTHCNAGRLATSEYGTALAPVYLAHERGQKIEVFVDETRPVLQGARLTAWELSRAGIKTTLICDNMAAVVMKEKLIDAVLVGADRIAANGDTANKIGTYNLAILAKFHKIPFYVLAPTSTFDLNCPDGSFIPVEKRDADEIARIGKTKIAPDGIQFFSPAFDVTPASLITAIICEHGIARPDYTKSLRRMVNSSTT